MSSTRLWTDDEWRAAMSAKEINDLPDSAFAYIESGGEKDDDGRTTPRALRHYPVQDQAHARNAYSRASAALEGDDEEAKAIAEKAMAKIKAACEKFGVEMDESKSRRSVAWRQRRAKELRGTERRTRLERVELREAGDGVLHLTGYASVTDTPYDMGWYSERIAQGAFKKTLAEDPDVQLLINHAGLPLARTKSGTLKLAEDNIGLRVDADLDAEDPDVQSLSRKMQRGDVDQMSFAFRTVRQNWNEDYSDREITEADIHRGDVSVVNQGANGATTSSIRSDDALVALRRLGAIGTLEAFFEARDATDLTDQHVEYLSMLVNAFAPDDAECEEARRILTERASPKAADAKVAAALAAAHQWVASAMEEQSKDPDNNTDPDDADVWKLLQLALETLTEAIKAQAKDGSQDPPADPPAPDGAGGDGGDDTPPSDGDAAADARAAALVRHDAERMALEEMRHAPRRVVEVYA